MTAPLPPLSRPARAASASPGRARMPGRTACLAVLMLAAIAAGPRPARAQAGAACDPAGDQQQINACAVRAFQQADSRLNIRYREVMESLPADRRVALRQQQREWLRARDAGCKTETRRYEGGSAWPLAYHGCLERTTVRRTGELDRQPPPVRP